jgi:SAM-dependent methyltransferase
MQPSTCTIGGNLELPAAAVKTSISPASASIIEAIEWLIDTDIEVIAPACPNCNNIDSKQTILRTSWPQATTRDGKVSFLRCSACGCGFVHPARMADYAAEPAGGESALAFYLQQGAGLWGISSNLSKLNRPAGTRLLEVGCGFGFGLDFARRALGWEVLGLDPSPLAAAGRACLRLPIESRYLVKNDPDFVDRFDVVMASEVIEHTSSPPAFVKTLRTALRDGGTLVLTTPDVEAVGPATPRGILIPVLSIGYHLVLQSAASLARLLRDAGFVDIDVHRNGGGQLTAFCRRASIIPAPIASEPAHSGNREQYRRYLDDVAQAVERDGDLWFGVIARAYREAVAVGLADGQSADALWHEFSAGCRRRFGFDPEAGARFALGPAGEFLESLVVWEPLCLGPVLLHRAFHCLQSGGQRRTVEGVFVRSANASRRLRQSLQRIGSDDGDAEDVGWVAAAEALLCAAERGADDVPERFSALGKSPIDALARRDGQPLRTEHYRRRIFVSLVNATRLEQADRLADVVGEVEVRATLPDVPLADDELDVLYCAAVRELQRCSGGADRALDLLRKLRVACHAARALGRTGSAVTLMAPARDAETLALNVLGRQQEANLGSEESMGSVET